MKESNISGLIFHLLWMVRIPAVYADNLSLLSETLRTYQQAACDETTVTLKCPSGTSITIQVAQYGKIHANNVCETELEKKFNPVAVEVIGNTSCKWPNALQYSLLQTVVEACQKKRQCKFQTSPTAFGVDPCPGARKFVEVAYKCRPYEFRSKVGCQNDVIHLSCNPYSRIAIYSASFGRIEHESIQCPQPQGVPEETCLSPHSTERVLDLCHGKRRCVLSADTTTFGTPCKRESRMYLKVVYTCVPRKVLKESYEGSLEEDEVILRGGINHDDLYDNQSEEEHWYREPSAIPPAPKVAVVPTSASNINGSSFSPSMDVAQSTGDPHFTANGNYGTIDAMYLYIILSVGISILLCLGLVIARCMVRRHYMKRDSKGPDISATTDLPNGFNDSISEVDNDIDMTNVTPVPIPAVASMNIERLPFAEMSLGPKGSLYVGRPVPNTYPHGPPNMYGPAEEYTGVIPRGMLEPSTLRRGVQLQVPTQVPLHTDVIVSPRSLNRYSNAQYYYG